MFSRFEDGREMEYNFITVLSFQDFEAGESGTHSAWPVNPFKHYNVLMCSFKTLQNVWKYSKSNDGVSISPEV